MLQLFDRKSNQHGIILPTTHFSLYATKLFSVNLFQRYECSEFISEDKLVSTEAHPCFSLAYCIIGRKQIGFQLLVL